MRYAQPEYCGITTELNRFAYWQNRADEQNLREERAISNARGEKVAYHCGYSPAAREELEEAAYSDVRQFGGSVEEARARLRSMTWGEFCNLQGQDHAERLDELTITIMKERRY